jgi:hypothetical protein
LAIHFTPGERWDYSGEGYSYLQSVVTQLVGRVHPKDCKTFDDGVRVCVTDFAAYMKTNLLVPRNDNEPLWIVEYRSPGFSNV